MSKLPQALDAFDGLLGPETAEEKAVARGLQEDPETRDTELQETVLRTPDEATIESDDSTIPGPDAWMQDRRPPGKTDNEVDLHPGRASQLTAALRILGAGIRSFQADVLGALAHVRRDPRIDVLEAEVAALRVEFNNLSSIVHEDHPQIQAFKTALASHGTKHNLTLGLLALVIVVGGGGLIVIVLLLGSLVAR